MPPLIPIVLVFGAFIAIAALAGKKGEAATLPPPGEAPAQLPDGTTESPIRIPWEGYTAPPVPVVPTPAAQVPGATFPASCTLQDRAYIKNVASNLSGMTPDAVKQAYALSIKCGLTQTAAQFAAWLNAKEAATSPMSQLAKLIAAPDEPSRPVPADPASGKPIWKTKVNKKTGDMIVIPMFTPVLELFKRLQSIVGAEQDGRLGPESITKFRNMMRKKGYKKYPQNAPTLAANVSKYIAVLTKNTPSSQVGARGGSGPRSPFPGC